jgi:predicted MPP superfamily phosphohydrolase
MGPISRRRFLGAAATAGAAAAAAAVARPAHAEAAEADTLRAEAVEFQVPGLDPRHDGLRVAQLSDVHVGPRTPPERVRAAVALANSFDPDLVALTGDFLSRGRRGLPLLRDQLDGLRAGAVVAVLGNHDHWVDPEGARRVLEAMGYALLRNQHTVLRLRGAPLAAVGVDDLFTRHADPARALAGVPRGSRLVLAHGPRTADLLRGRGEPFLVLSGHTHGGQINLGAFTRFMIESVVKEPYWRGRYQVGPVQLYVNRGVGSSIFRLRVNSDPEVTLATLRAVEQA